MVGVPLYMIYTLLCSLTQRAGGDDSAFTAVDVHPSILARSPARSLVLIWPLAVPQLDLKNRFGCIGFQQLPNWLRRTLREIADRNFGKPRGCIVLRAVAKSLRRSLLEISDQI